MTVGQEVSSQNYCNFSAVASVFQINPLIFSGQVTMDVWEPRVSVFGKWTLTLHTLTLEELLSYFSILIRDISIFVVSIFAFEKVFVIEIKNFHTDKHTFMYD